MGFWVHIHWIGMSLQIAAALVGRGLAWSWLRVKDGDIEVNPKRLKVTSKFGAILLWALAVGFIFELWYEAHLLA